MVAVANSAPTIAQNRDGCNRIDIRLKLRILPIARQRLILPSIRRPIASFRRKELAAFFERNP